MRNTIRISYFLLLAFFLFHTSRSFSQDSPSRSLIRNDNGSVTFVYNDSAAKKVKIACDCRLHRETKDIKRENYHTAKMKADSFGIWTYTTPPLSSEVYTYHFLVDGRAIPDPLNPDSVRVRTEKLSVFTIAETPQTRLYVSDTLHGRLDTVVFSNSNGGKNRLILVYTPPQYYCDTTKLFPALYLLHGLNGNETSWIDRGCAANILDNLILSRSATPMVLVMPDANPECLISQKENVGLMKNLLLFPTWNKLEFEKTFPQMDSFLCSQYRIADPNGGRAVAGLSAGAKQAANLANMYDSTFRYVGLFSPVVNRKQLPYKRYSKYWIGGGTADLFHWQINSFRKKMHRKHISYTMYNSVGGHTWRNWRIYLTEFLQIIVFH